MGDIEWLLTSCLTSSPTTDLSAREVDNTRRPPNNGVRATGRVERQAVRL